MNYYAPITNDHQTAFDACLTEALKIAVSNDCNQLLIVVPQRGTLPESAIEKTLGHRAVNNLMLKKKTFLDPITLFLQTRRSKPEGFVRGPVLAAYAHIDQLKKLSKNSDIPGIVLYSDAPEDIEAFREMSDAKELKITF